MMISENLDKSHNSDAMSCELRSPTDRRANNTVNDCDLAAAGHVTNAS